MTAENENIRIKLIHSRSIIKLVSDKTIDSFKGKVLVIII